MKHREIEVNGITLHFVEAGEGSAVLFYHGFLAVWSSWKSQMKLVAAAGFNAIALDATAIRFAVEEAVATPGSLDFLVNNAGIAIPKKFEDTTLEEFEGVININLRSVFVTTQVVLEHLNDNGRIINIGSCVGERATMLGLAAYASTKGAVKMFAQALSREVGSRGITVNNIQPGPIDTDLNPAAGDRASGWKTSTALDRYGKVDEVTALIASVAGPESSYITGANLTVGGGTDA